MTVEHFDKWQSVYEEYISLLDERRKMGIEGGSEMQNDPAVFLSVGDSFDYPLRKALNIISGRWKVPILFEIFNSNPIRFNTLKKQLEGVSVSMLSTSLKELTDDGLVSRIQYNEIPLRVEYSLTEKGISLFYILMDLSRWEYLYGK